MKSTVLPIDAPYPRRSFRLLVAVALVVAAGLAASAPQAQADTPIVQIGENGQQSCGPFDPDCRKTIESSLEDGHVSPIEVTDGVTFGGRGGAGSAIRFSTRLFEVDRTAGDLQALMFDAAYLSDGGFRVRFTLADTQALFMCHDQQGKTQAPLLATTPLVDCKPEPGGTLATFGAGAQLVQVRWDEVSGRFAARWAQMQAVVNLLRNANTEDYLRRRLQAFAGVNIDSIFYEGAGTPSSSTLPRYSFGISGLYRTENNHWSITGVAGFRQDVIDPSNYSFESRAQALYEILSPNQAVKRLEVGIDAEYQYNSVPADSMGEFVSATDRSSAYLGAILGFKFD